jgi:MoaA/NifB/PqqE/SkfB family radical SAM enzyme
MLSEQFKQHKIKYLQLDPYGVCNAKCWFCPVRYKVTPDQSKDAMSPELLRKILKNIVDERTKEDGLVDKKFGAFYTAHYNEILLYPHFEELLKMCKEYKLCFVILSNGIPLTPERIDLISNYKEVVSAICLNIPAFDAETWSKRSGINIKLYDRLISNINYGIEKLPGKVKNSSFSIIVNGVNENSLIEKGGDITKGIDFPDDMDLNSVHGEMAKQILLAKQLFPKLHITTNANLWDRGGSISNVMVSRNYSIKHKNPKAIKGNVIGCANDAHIGGRPVGWLHINASGNAFLCCNDYEMEITFGDFNTQELKDFWGLEDHQEKIKQSYQTVCSKCSEAIYE